MTEAVDATVDGDVARLSALGRHMLDEWGQQPFRERAGEIYDHHSGFLFPKWDYEREEPERILRSARRRHDVAHAESFCPWIAPGHRFLLDDHPLERLNRPYIPVTVKLRRGRARPSQTAPQRSALTGELVLAERVIIRDTDVNGDSVLVEDVVEGAPFVVDSASGTVTVVPQEAQLHVPVTRAFQDGGPRVAGEGPNTPLTEAVRAWVAGRRHHIAPRDLRVVVRHIAAGDEIVIHAAHGAPPLIAAPSALEGGWDLLAAVLLGALALLSGIGAVTAFVAGW